MKRLNMLNRVVNKNVEQVHPVSKVEFYEVYLKLFNIAVPENKKLTPQEIQVLARILSFPKGKDCFTGVYAKLIREELSIKSPNYIKLKKKLEDKGYIKDNLTTLVSLQDYFTEDMSYEFVYAMKVTKK
jgi:hypothetical protein